MEERRATVGHFFGHGQCLARTVRLLGYPKSTELLAQWIEELEPGRRRIRAKAGSFTDEQRVAAERVGVTRAVPCKWKASAMGKGASPMPEKLNETDDI